MKRNHNTTRSGASFTDSTIEAVWNKARVIPGKPGYAKDACGATIYRHSYGKTSGLGFEIDHILPVSKGGGDELSNLQPLHWKNNRRKGDMHPETRYCVVNS